MIFYPNSKINLGLSVLQKRVDGFHDIESVFYPVNWCDALEIIETEDRIPFRINCSGLSVNGKPEDNLIYKAWKKMAEKSDFPPIQVHLHKIIPMGAGLGGGSADAAFFIKETNSMFRLGFTDSELMEMASAIGSDCAFFLKNKALIASGKGNVFSEIKVDLSSFYIALIYPNLHSNTALAYAELDPARKRQADIKKTVENLPIKEWKEHLFNDFEHSVFKKMPAAFEVKQALYQQGALYASLSGSGSAVYGIFEKEPALDQFKSFNYFLQKPAFKVL